MVDLFLLKNELFNARMKYHPWRLKFLIIFMSAFDVWSCNGHIQRFCRLVLKMDSIGREILTIAVPAAMAFAADPVASLIDTAFIGHIGIYALIITSSDPISVNYFIILEY